MTDHHYTECGLQNVYVAGLPAIVDDDGNAVISIPAVNVLHRKIAEGIVLHDKGMSGSELRFLRTEMGLTQAELATSVHYDKQSIGRWERSETGIDGASEVVIRRLAIEKLCLPVSESIDMLARRTVPTAEVQPIAITVSNGGYELEAA